MANFRLSSDGIAFLEKREAVIPYVYDDGRGATPGGNPERDRAKGRCLTDWSQFKAYPTIAMGLRIYPDDYDRFAPYLDCNYVSDSLLKDLIREPIVEREEKLNELLDGIPVTQAMFDALFFMMYNTGHGNSSFKKAIAALAKTDSAGKPAPDYTAAQQAIANGPVTSKGEYKASLAERRQLEAEWFMREGLPRKGVAALFQKGAGGDGPSPLVLALVGSAAATTLALVWVYRDRLRGTVARGGERVKALAQRVVPMRKNRRSRGSRKGR